MPKDLPASKCYALFPDFHNWQVFFRVWNSHFARLGGVFKVMVRTYNMHFAPSISFHLLDEYFAVHALIIHNITQQP